MLTEGAGDAPRNEGDRQPMTARAWYDPARGTWVAIYSIAGRKHPKKEYGYKTKKEALARAQDQVSGQRHGTFVDPSKASTLLAAVAEAWIPVHATRVRHMDQYLSTLRNIVAAWGTSPVADLDTYTLESWIVGLERQRGLSASYAHQHRTVLRLVLDFAKARGMIHTNPLAGRPPRVSRATAKVQVPSPADVLAAWSRPELPDHAGIGWVLLTEAGVRPSEALNIRPDRDIDYRERVLWVRGQLDKHGALDATTKTPDSVRPVPVDDAFLEAVNLHIAQHGLSTAGTLLADSYGNPCRDHTFLVYSTKAWKAAGLPFRNQSLRRYYATGLLDAGVPESVIDRVLGHSPGTVLRRHYVKLTEDQCQQVRDALPSLRWRENAPQTRRNEGTTGL